MESGIMIKTVVYYKGIKRACLEACLFGLFLYRYQGETICRKDKTQYSR